MTAVTFSKSSMFTELIRLTTTKRCFISNTWAEVNNIESLVFLIIVILLRVVPSLTIVGPRMLHEISYKLSKTLGSWFSKTYKAYQSWEAALIMLFHSLICKGPKRKPKLNKVQRKTRGYRSCSGSQWRLRLFKVRLKHPQFESCCNFTESISIKMAKRSERKKTTFDTASIPVGMDTQASRSICTNKEMMRSYLHSISQRSTGQEVRLDSLALPYSTTIAVYSVGVKEDRKP